ncbi:MAG TPA: hypothetical protein VJV79_32870 [Polyangiaceae bacterium]|nr:hypothetical protein [Polyangiaceae bacterium]
MAYVLANPTSAMLVQSPDEWPGVLSQWSKAILNVEMPDIFFDKSGDLPKEIPLEIVRPQIFQQLTDEQLAESLRDEVETLVKGARDVAARTESSFVGAAAALSRAHESNPSKQERLGALNPRIAAQSPAVRVQAIQKMRAFAKAYRAAWLRWRDGIRDVIFPAGTYALRLHSGVLCAPG